MRILHIPHAYSPVLGGAELLCQRLSEKLASSGHQVSVFTSDVGDVNGYYQLDVKSVRGSTETLNGVMIKRFAYCGARYYRLGSRIIGLVPGKRARARIGSHILRSLSQKFSEAVLEEIGTFRPDVVMTMPHLVANVQAVLQVHRNECFPLVLIPLVHADWTDSIKREMARACEQADAVVASTAAEARQIQSEWGILANKVFTVWLGVDLPPMSCAAHRLPHVLFLGRKVPRKGIDHLVAAMRFVWGERPDARLILAGARTPQTEPIVRMIASLPQSESERILSLDNVTETTKLELLATATCLVLPSRSESFGIVLLEAMANRTPVVALDLPIFREVVTTGEDGLLVPPDDPENMAKALLFLLNNPTMAAEMGHRGRDKVARRFTWDQVADRYLLAYEYAIAERGHEA